MKALVIALCCLAAARADVQSSEPDETHPWNSTKLKRYQKAWKAMNQTIGTKYYFVRSTYNEDSVWGSNFSCISVEVIARNESYKSVTYNATYRNSTTGKMASINETVVAVNGSGYISKNVIQWQMPNGTTLNDTVVFTDGKICDVLYVPYKDGYELWVHQNYLNNTPSCCNYVFDLVSLKKDQYTIYNDTICRDVNKPSTK